jgi:hypothetical protein
VNCLRIILKIFSVLFAIAGGIIFLAGALETGQGVWIVLTIFVFIMVLVILFVKYSL